MRVLTSSAETGAVTLSIPQDVQAEAFDFPVSLFKKRVWAIQRARPDKEIISKAIELIKESSKPLIISGGGTIYSDAVGDLNKLVDQTGIPVAETFAGKGALCFDKAESLGAIGATGTPGAVSMAKEADLIIGIGTRYSDFTTASKTAFQNPDVKFININVTESDSHKHSALPVIADAKEALKEIVEGLKDYKVNTAWNQRAAAFNKSWNERVSDYYADKKQTPVTQAEVIGAVNNYCSPEDVVLCAAGSLPGDLHKLWRTRDKKGFHLEYGYSTMGYEIAAGLGAKMACPEREIYVMVGDGNYLMNNHEIITAIQEGVKITIILLNNNGFGSIGALSQSLGSKRFGTKYRFRNKETGQIDGDILPVDFVQNAKSIGANVLEATDINSLNESLKKAKASDKTTLIYIETDLEKGVEGYAWWEVPVAEVSEMDSVNEAYKTYQENKKNQKYYL